MIVAVQSLKDKLEKSEKTFWNKVDLVAKSVRKDYIIPVCDYYKLSFYSGHGTFFFVEGNNRPKYSLTEDQVITPDISPANIEKYGLADIFKALDIQVAHNQYLGYFVEDYVFAGKPRVKRRSK